MQDKLSTYLKRSIHANERLLQYSIKFYTYCIARMDFRLDLSDRNRRDFHYHSRTTHSNRKDLERKDRKSISLDSQYEDFLDILEDTCTAPDDYWTRTLYFLRSRTRRKD